MISEAKISLSMSLTANGLAIQARNPDDSSRLLFAHIAQISQCKGLSEWFDSLEDVKNHLIMEQHYVVDWQNKKMKITGKHPTKSSSYLEIARVRLQEKALNPALSGNLSDVLKLCQNTQPLEQSKIRQVIGILVKAIIKLTGQYERRPTTQAQDGSESFDRSDISSKIQSNIKSYVSEVGQEQRNSMSIERIKHEIKQKDQVIDAVINKIKIYSNDTTSRIEKLQDRVELLEHKLEQAANKIEELVSMQKSVACVDEHCFSFDKLILNGSSITKCRGEEADIFFKTRITDKSSFTIRIDSLKEWMCVGIADSNLKIRQSFVNVPTCVVYYSDGNFYNGLSLRGKIFKKFNAGDVIKVQVDLVQGKIQWKVGGQVRVSYNYDLLKDPSVLWVPYIWLLGNGDSVYIVD